MLCSLLGGILAEINCPKEILSMAILSQYIMESPCREPSKYDNKIITRLTRRADAGSRGERGLCSVCELFVCGFDLCSVFFLVFQIDSVSVSYNYFAKKDGFFYGHPKYHEVSGIAICALAVRLVRCFVELSVPKFIRKHLSLALSRKRCFMASLYFAVEEQNAMGNAKAH